MNNEEEYNCPLSGSCGGCFYTDITMEEELHQKNKKVSQLLTESHPEPFAYEGILQSPIVKGYRNKMEYSFGDGIKDGPLELGLHKKKSFYSILTTDCCEIVHEDFNQIVAATLEFFREAGCSYVHKKSHEGYLRHLLVRRAVKTGQILVDLVTTTQNPAGEKELLEAYKERLLSLQSEGKLTGTIRGILHTKNDSLSDAVVDQGTETLYGTDRIEEELLGLKFSITPFSFFQTNSLGAEVLYQKVRAYVSGALEKDKTVFDLYSGTGTIAQIISPMVKKVVGIEIVTEAVEAARENAKRNGLENCEFIAGDVLTVLDQVKEKPDVIILDPPRDGANPKALRKILAYGVETIVYVSCNPVTLARDLLSFQLSGYRLVKACAVNQFPRTKHVETVVLMSGVDK